MQFEHNLKTDRVALSLFVSDTTKLEVKFDKPSKKKKTTATSDDSLPNQIYNDDTDVITIDPGARTVVNNCSRFGRTFG